MLFLQDRRGAGAATPVNSDVELIVAPRFFFHYLIRDAPVYSSRFSVVIGDVKFENLLIATVHVSVDVFL
jgi:hypothetical protein